MTEVNPEMRRDTVSQNPVTSEPRNPLTDFQELATEDPALLLHILGVSAQDLGRVEDPSQLNSKTVWSLVVANQQNAEKPSPDERVEHATRTIQQVLGMFTASKMEADEEAKRHPLYEEQIFRLRLIQWASKPNPQAEAAVRQRMHEVALGIRVFGIAQQALRQSLEEAASNTLPDVPQQREPTEKSALSTV